MEPSLNTFPSLDQVADPGASIAATEGSYKPLLFRYLWRSNLPSLRWRLLAAWLLAGVSCVLLGLLADASHWSSGVPLKFGSVELFVSLYPPQIICLLLTLCLGWTWGAIPAYATSLILALHGGMPAMWALLFACGNPLGFAIMTIGYQAIPIRRELPGWIAALAFIQWSFVAAIFSSVAALIWSYTNQLRQSRLLDNWQGWWLGDFLQSVFIAGPLLAWLWPLVQRWRLGHPELFEDFTATRRRVLGLLAAVTAGIIFFAFETVRLSTRHSSLALPDDFGVLRHNVDVTQKTLWVLFWVFSELFLFIALMGYQLYEYWQRANEKLMDELRHTNAALNHLARTDGLTGLLNRRAVDNHLQSEFDRALRTGNFPSLLIIDIDHFKLINDRFGHPAGDTVICRIAAMIQETVREIDIAARYGGEEFLVMLPETDGAQALKLAERLRKKVLDEEISHETYRIRCQISIGVSCLRAQDTDHAVWLYRADQALYAAKAGGRNQVVVG